jgi:signal transduction histidine kinase
MAALWWRGVIDKEARGVLRGFAPAFWIEAAGKTMRIFRRSSTSPLTIRTLVVVWAGSIFLVWAILVSGWLVAKTRLSHLAGQVAADVRALDTSRRLELAILAYRREYLLWKATGQDTHRQRSEEGMRNAEQIAADIGRLANTDEERAQTAEIQRMLTGLREQGLSSVAPEAETQATDDLLTAVEQFQMQDEGQMGASTRAADRLYQAMSYWTLGLSLGTAGLLFLGSFTIISRVVRPVLGLTDAANAFGRGDLSRRATVLRNDEMGALARTFNNMADDIAEREQERLRFTALVAHDLKNPALAIEMGTELLRRSIDNEQERASYLDAIAEEAKRLRKIVRDLTDDIQVASGRFSVHKGRVELGELVRRLVRTQGNSFTSHEMVIEAEECVVSGDADRIERVVTNLLSNAVKYSPPHTRITVRVRKKRASALLSVSDQGPGIAKEDLGVLFQPFGRGRSAHTLAEGTGIGLYVVKQIVEAHDGRIDVQSEPGKGATFTITLPLARVQSAGESSAPDAGLSPEESGRSRLAHPSTPR